MDKKLKKAFDYQARVLAAQYVAKGLDDAVEEGKKIVGNWKKFDSFCLFGKEPDPSRYAIVYTHNRDSGILATVNAKIIKQVLDRFKRDCCEVSHNHWAVGHVDGWEIKVFKKDGTPTDAWCAYCGIQNDLQDYPVLDDDAFSNAEYASVIDSIESEGRHLLKAGTPENWEYEVYDWLSQNNETAVEVVDDQGGYVSDDDIKPALKALGYLDPDCDDEEEEESEEESEEE